MVKRRKRAAVHAVTQPRQPRMRVRQVCPRNGDGVRSRPAGRRRRKAFCRRRNGILFKTGDARLPHIPRHVHGTHRYRMHPVPVSPDRYACRPRRLGAPRIRPAPSVHPVFHAPDSRQRFPDFIPQKRYQIPIRPRVRHDGCRRRGRPRPVDLNRRPKRRARVPVPVLATDIHRMRAVRQRGDIQRIRPRRRIHPRIPPVIDSVDAVLDPSAFLQRRQLRSVRLIVHDPRPRHAHTASLRPCARRYRYACRLRRLQCVRHNRRCRKTRIARLLLPACRQHDKLVRYRVVACVIVAVRRRGRRRQFRPAPVQMQPIPPLRNLLLRWPDPLPRRAPAHCFAHVDIFVRSAVVDPHIIRIAVAVRTRAPQRFPAQLDRSRSVRVARRPCLHRVPLVDSVRCDRQRERIVHPHRRPCAVAQRKSVVRLLFQNMEPRRHDRRDVPRGKPRRPLPR